MTETQMAKRTADNAVQWSHVLVKGGLRPYAVGTFGGWLAVDTETPIPEPLTHEWVVVGDATAQERMIGILRAIDGWDTSVRLEKGGTVVESTSGERKAVFYLSRTLREGLEDFDAGIAYDPVDRVIVHVRGAVEIS